MLAQKYLEMGQAIGESPSSKVLFMDPDSIPAAIQALLAMNDIKITETMTEKITEAIAKQPYGASGNIPPTLRNLPELKQFPPPSDSEKDPSSSN